MRLPGYTPATVDKVSIHASVKDATTIGHIVGQLLHVSIHASVKDATFDKIKCFLTFCFNPRICKDAALIVNKFLNLL